VAIDRRILDLAPADDPALARLVVGLMRSGDAAGAVAAARSLVQRRPEDLTARLWLRNAERYRELEDAATPGVADAAWVAVSRFLAGQFPATAAETWEIERDMPTESFSLEQARGE
jgi:hypothetical protein